MLFSQINKFLLRCCRGKYEQIIFAVPHKPAHVGREGSNSCHCTSSGGMKWTVHVTKSDFKLLVKKYIKLFNIQKD